MDSLNRTSALSLLLALVLGCSQKPDVSGPEPAKYDGASLPDTAGLPDAIAVDDEGKPVLTDDGTVPGDEGYVPDPTDTDEPDGTIGPPPPKDTSGPDTTPPAVISAFSADGKTVTVRFSEEMDPSTGGTVGNYTIKGSDNSIVALTGATVKGRYVELGLANPGDVNPDLTYTCYVKNVLDLASPPNALDATKSSALVKRTVYLNIIWHQHQPLYYDATRDQLSGPWVRKHATKDYYDMASILAEYPEVHLNINLTIVLLMQLQIYIDRLLPYVDKTTNTVDEKGFLATWKGKTDPFVDLLLMDTPSPKTATPEQIGLFYDDPWATVSTNDATLVRWPEYLAIREKNPALLTQDDFLKLKIFFELAWFDPDFLQGPVTLTTGDVVDLSDLVTKHANGTYTLAKPASEEMANRLVAENAKIIEAVVPIHKALMYDYQTREGQIEITTTPYYHPILPLIHDTNLAKKGMEFDPLPDPAFGFPEDAEAQVLKAVATYEDIFGIPPQGIWCGEGSVAEEIIPVLREAGFRWTATDQQVLEKSTPSNQKHWYAYRVDGDKVAGDGGNHDDEMLIVFRNTNMSNDIGFKYQAYWGGDAADEIVANVLAQAPPFGGKDRMVTLIVDGENAWEEYKYEHDGKGFHHALYAALRESYDVGELITVTVSEYIDGNPERAVPPHPVSEHTELEPLWPGSWIDGTYAIWIGEGEENVAWEYILQTRTDLQKSGLPRPNPLAPMPADVGSKGWLIWQAWEEIYAAEGSDWFWWYGADMTTPANDDTPFDIGFRAHLTGTYQFMNAALAMEGKPPFPIPDFKPIVQAQPQPPSGPFTPGTEPVLDGKLVPNEVEWTSEGGFFFDNDSGAQANQDDDIALVYYGYTNEALYVGIQANENLHGKLGTDYEVALYASHKHITSLETGQAQKDPANQKSRYGTDLEMAMGAAREVRFQFEGASLAMELNLANGSGGWKAAAKNSIEVGPLQTKGKLIELKVPWADLNLVLSDPLEIAVVASEGGKDLDKAPTLGGKTVFDDLTNVVYVTFQCDVTEGSGIAIDTYVDITTPPPPKGKGIVYISGNHDKLMQWIPNKLPMVDDGNPPDKKANDGIWTIAVPFAPGTLLRYKYTIGLPKNEGKWSGTEEFPLTERGLDITKDPTKKKMVVHDIFADRPQPTGTQGKKTFVELLE